MGKISGCRRKAERLGTPLGDRARFHAGVVVFFLTLLAMGGCRRGIPVPANLPDGVYPSTLNAWTRQARYYRGLDLQLLIDATYKSAAFRKAFVEEYVKRYALGDAEKKKRWDEERRTAERFHEFIAAVYVPDSKLDNFEKPDAYWRVYLTVGGQGRNRPVEIVKKKRNDPELLHFFPYLTPWKSVYLFRFDRFGPEPGDRHRDDDLLLEIAGVTAHARLTWGLPEVLDR